MNKDEEEKDDINNDPFNWFGSPKANKKFYWVAIAILAVIETLLGISIFISHGN